MNAYRDGVMAYGVIGRPESSIRQGKTTKWKSCALACVGLFCAVGAAGATGLLSNVPEAGSYSLVYEFPIPARTPGWNANPVPYSVNNSTNIVPGSFSRIAYYLEMVTAGGATQWLYVSMSAFTTNAFKIGVPTTGSGELYHYPNTYDSGPPTNATVLSNVSGITNGTGIDTINLEFWPSDFGPNNNPGNGGYGVPGASDTAFDFGDGGGSTGSGHGSMQIHNYGAKQTLFAYNSWGAPPLRASALGIGNQPSGEPDWVFNEANISNYVSCTLQILIGNGGTPDITSLPATDIGTNAVTLVGSLTSTGSSATAVTVYWGPNDGGTTPANWTNTIPFPGTQNPGTLSTNITGLSDRTSYAYRFMASNSAGVIWSPVSTVWTRTQFGMWPYQEPLTFTGYTQSGPLTNFPVLVVLGTNIEGFSYNQFQSGSHDDLAFSDGAQSNDLSYDIEQWNTNGLSYVWVKVPLLQDSNTVIRAYWGRSGLTAPSWATNGSVWSEGYSGVWHMQSTNASDSSANGNNGLASGGVMSVSGPVGRANSFDGASGFITVPPTDLDQGNDDVMVEFWLNPADTQPNYANIIDYNYSVGPNQNWMVELYSQSRQFSWAVRTTANNWGPWETPMIFTPAASTWTHMVLMKSGPNYTYYMNGLPTASRSYTASRTKSAKQLRFGANAQNALNLYAGVLDEIRISHQARSSAWVWANWMNMASNDVFTSYGAIISPLPMIANLAPSNVMVGSATLNGSLISIGASPTTVAVYWGPTDGGEIASAWAHTNFFAGNPDPGPLSTNLMGLAANIMCYYRYAAMNAAGTNWSPTAASFLPGEMTVSATGPTAFRKQPGIFTVSRPAEATNGALVVNYSVGGTASNGVDVSELTGTVTILDGAATATVAVTMNSSAKIESAKTVVLTLQPGAYVIGTPFSDTVTMHIPSVTYMGAEITSDNHLSSWGTSPGSGYKKDFRSTDTDPKSFILPGHQNAYGADGYVFFSSLQTVYFSGTHPSPTLYSNSAPYITAVEILPWSGSAQQSAVTINDPTPGIGAGISDVVCGVLYSSWADSGVQESCDRIRITFGPSAALAQKIRIGIMAGTGGDQKPAAFTLGGATGNATGISAYDAPDWYFFDATNMADGDELILNITESGIASMQSGFSGLIFDSVIQNNHAPVILSAGAGPNPALFTASGNATGTLSAAATDPDGNPLTYTWSVVSGPGTVSFGAANAATSSVSVTAVGTYVLRFSASDGIAAPVSSNVTFTSEAQPGVLYVMFTGAEISSVAAGGWGSSASTGWKVDFRSTDVGTKVFALPNHPNAYGQDGYIMFCTDNTNQESNGYYKGTLYTGTRSGAMFSNPCSYVNSVAILGVNGGSAGQWFLDTQGGWIDDPSVGIGAGVTNIFGGSLWRIASGGTNIPSLQITFSDSIVDMEKIRIGIRVDRGNEQKPSFIGLSGATVPAAGQDGYNFPDWYFFDVLNAHVGDSVVLSVDHGVMQGIVFDSLVATRGAVFFIR